MGGHFRLKSGEHSIHYLRKEVVYEDPALTSQVIRFANQEIENSVRDGTMEPFDIVATPEGGGAIIGSRVAFASASKLIWCEHEMIGSAMKIKRGFDRLLTEGRRILLLDDVLTKGTTFKEMVEALKQYPVVVVGALCVFKRGTTTAEDLGVPKLISLFDMPLVTWSENECPSCKDKVSLNSQFGYG